MSIDDVPVSKAPPYTPEDLAGLWAATDMLVVPSVMRESHSLVTREALTAGVPVICTDSLGPEEVVRDGVNGFVVPAADPALLAAAMERPLLDPTLLDRLRTECRAVPVRPLQSQVEGLSSLFSELATKQPREPAVGARRAIRRVLFLVGIDGAPLRYRAQLPAEALALLGVESEVRYYRDAGVDALADRADAVVVYRVPATIQVLETIRRTRRAACPSCSMSTI